MPNIYYKTFVLLLSLFATTLNAELVKSYFSTGELKAETNYIDGTNTEIKEGVKDGLEKVYYIEGGLAYSVNYRNNKRDGKLTWYDKKGRKIAEMFYKDGKLEGVERAYFPNGKVKYIVNYVNDKKEGLQKEYYDNGVLALVVPYKNNKKEGIQREYTYEGKLYSQVRYVNNYKEGFQRWYDENGNVVKRELFKMDRPVNVMQKIQNKKNERKIIIDTIDFSPKKAQ